MKFGWSSRTRACAAVFAAVVGGAAGIVLADDLYVQPLKLDVREGPGLLFDPVDSVKKNDKLHVLEKTDDGWFKVQTPGGKQGYVFKESVKSQPAAAPGPLAGLNVTSNAEAAEMSQGAAGKGLEPETDNYARSKNYDRTALNRVIAMNAPGSQKARDWMQFCKEGKVGPARPSQK
jgi:uncharacterized protein YgiM (DUF1202 family)